MNFKSPYVGVALDKKQTGGRGEKKIHIQSSRVKYYCHNMMPLFFAYGDKVVRLRIF